MLVVLSLLWLNSPAQTQSSGLQKVDIADPSNTPAVSQVVSNADGSFTVTAGGNDTWDSSDSFYLPLRAESR